MQIGSEMRISDFETSDYRKAIDWCQHYAEKNEGCRAYVIVTVPRIGLTPVNFCLYDCCYPNVLVP